MSSEEAKLKRVLTRGDLLGIAIGQIIGAGIMSLTGIAIGMTGSGVLLAFILSAVVTLFRSMPQAVLGTALPTTGGSYRYVSRLLTPKLGFVYVAMSTFCQVTLAMYALSFADYACSLWPALNRAVVAGALMTVCYLVNLFGIKQAAVLQKSMVYVLIGSLLAFTLFGLPRVDASVFCRAAMFPNGPKGFLTAVALLSFATGGATVIVELGGEMKRPQHDIPYTVIVSTFACALLYAGMSAVASGVLPIEQVANRPLTEVARTVLPRALFFVFMTGGAMFAVATTLNATLAWCTKGLLVACEDGWLPKSLGKVSEKYGTPIRLLTLFYVIGMLPILTGLSLATISMLGTGMISLTYLLPTIAAIYLPVKHPEQYRESPFYMKPALLNTVIVIAFLALAVQAYLLLSPLPKKILLGSAVIVAVAALYAFARGAALDKEGQAKELGF